ncbi:MAG TPA: L,D-transpeptidase family protein [Sphingomonas sp.]
MTRSPVRLLAIGVLALAGVLAVWALAQREPRQVAAMYRPSAAVQPAPSARPTPLAPIRMGAPVSKPTPTPTPTPFVIRRVMTLPGPFRHGNHYWDESDVPDGPLVITVDLAAQSLSVFRAGYEIGTAVILYGAQTKPTPLGIFKVTQKDADHVSNLYGAPMPYMLRLTNDGISIHGADVIRDAATHGCVGVPTAFARKLFKAVKLGDRVIVTNGERLKVGDAVKVPS